MVGGSVADYPPGSNVVNLQSSVFVQDFSAFSPASRLAFGIQRPSALAKRAKRGRIISVSACQRRSLVCSTPEGYLRIAAFASS